MTRLKPSPNNAAAEIGKILERFRLSQGWKAEEDEDHELRLQTFLEILGAARIPVDLYDRLYRRVSITRARKKANGESVSYHIAPEEMVAEYFTLQNELQKQEAEQTAPECVNVQYHVGDGTQVLADLFNTGKDEIAPCPVCRKADYFNWRKTQIALYGEVPIFRPAVSQKDGFEVTGGLFGKKLVEENLTDAEIADLLSQYHILVSQIVTDEKSRKALEVIFDEGANCFKMRNSYQTFSAKTFRRKIEDYQKLLGEREN